jgi:hypothetical protein
MSELLAFPQTEDNELKKGNAIVFFAGAQMVLMSRLLRKEKTFEIFYEVLKKVISLVQIS